MGHLQVALASKSSQASPPIQLLSDVQVATFLAQGFLPVKVVDLPPHVQPNLYTQSLSHLPENGGRGLGNNCLMALPGLHLVFERSGIVTVALQSLLGVNYSTNNHRHMHVSTTTVRPAFFVRAVPKFRSAATNIATVTTWQLDTVGAN